MLETHVLINCTTMHTILTVIYILLALQIRVTIVVTIDLTLEGMFLETVVILPQIILHVQQGGLNHTITHCCNVYIKYHKRDY